MVQKLAGSGRDEINVATTKTGKRNLAARIHRILNPGELVIERHRVASQMDFVSMEPLFLGPLPAAMSLLLRSGDVCNERLTCVTIVFRL